MPFRPHLPPTTCATCASATAPDGTINPDLLAALWEIKRLRLLAMQMYQVSFELKCPQGITAAVYDDLITKVRTEPCVTEHRDMIDELLDAPGKVRKGMAPRSAAAPGRPPAARLSAGFPPGGRNNPIEQRDQARRGFHDPRRWRRRPRHSTASGGQAARTPLAPSINISPQAIVLYLRIAHPSVCRPLGAGVAFVDAVHLGAPPRQDFRACRWPSATSSARSARWFASSAPYRQPCTVQARAAPAMVAAPRQPASTPSSSPAAIMSAPSSRAGSGNAGRP